jgi:ADP-ribose pyrophosphatase YjhB (NUDIX family)
MEYPKQYNNYCNNCGKSGHVFGQCKMPITSFGIIAFRVSPEGVIEYLMICRKDTLGYIDFLRGKYSIYNKYYIMNMMKQMTIHERNNLLVQNFDTLWADIWGNEVTKNEVTKNEVTKNEVTKNEVTKNEVTKNEVTKNEEEIIKPKLGSYRTEELVSSEKFEQLRGGKNALGHTLESMLKECNENSSWTEPEWGFPKGRRNYKEKDYDCALREFTEETGYPNHVLHNFQNIFPFDEIFMGSNYKSYKHKYYLTFMEYADSVKYGGHFQFAEVSKMEWKSLEDCLQCIRPYNVEKIKLMSHVHQCLSGKYRVVPNTTPY